MSTEEEHSGREYELFPFKLEDVFIVEELKDRIRKLLHRPGISPLQIRQIGTVLFALERLPRSTPGIAVGIGPRYSFNNESSYCDLFISEHEFRLGSGGSTYDPAVGGDHYSSTAFELGISGSREGYAESEEVSYWFSQFDELFNLGAKIEVDYVGEDELVDWSEEGSENFWDELEKNE